MTPVDLPSHCVNLRHRCSVSICHTLAASQLACHQTIGKFISKVRTCCSTHSNPGAWLLSPQAPPSWTPRRHRRWKTSVPINSKTCTTFQNPKTSAAGSATSHPAPQEANDACARLPTCSRVSFPVPLCLLAEPSPVCPMKGPPDWHPAPQDVKDACSRAAEYAKGKGVDIAKLVG